MEGKGMERNLAKAFELLQKSGTPSAAFNLGMMYADGKGVVRDVVKACKFFTIASAGGVEDAERTLEVLKAHLSRTGQLDKANTSSASSTSTLLKCSHCGVHGKCLRCGSCREAFYCSQDCQRSHWKVHKQRCLPPRPAPADTPEDVTNHRAKTAEAAAACGIDDPIFEHATKWSTQALRDSLQASVNTFMAQLPVPEDLEKCSETVFSEVDSETVRDNAEVAEALFRAGAEPEPVCLLEFSRDPESLQKAFEDSVKLQKCAKLLRDAGFHSTLASGARVFVQPDQFLPLKEALRLGGWEMKPRHVLCSMELEEEVLSVIKRIPRREKVRRKKQAARVPLGVPAFVVANDVNPEVKRSFITIKVPSSLRSDRASGTVTASTTDAKFAKGDVLVGNPRKA